MITIISGTNRIGSHSLKVSNICKSIVEKQNHVSHLIDLKMMSSTNLSSEMYLPDNQGSELSTVQDEILMPSKKWIIVIPEYNGGVPGIFKLFIDIISTRQKDQTFHNTSALLIGVAAGRAGNARGLDYLTNCLNYLGTNVFPTKLPISSINQVLTEGELNAGTYETLETTISNFLKA